MELDETQNLMETVKTLLLFRGCAVPHRVKSKTCLLKYRIVPMTAWGFLRLLWNNETPGHLVTCPGRFPFLPHIHTLCSPEKQIPLPERVAIPRDGFCLLQSELHQVIPLHLGRYHSTPSKDLSAPSPSLRWDLTPPLWAYQHDLVISFSLQT